MRQITIEIIREAENKREFKAYTDFEQLLSKLYKEMRKGRYDIQAYNMTVSTDFMIITEADDIVAFIGEIYKNGLL